MEIEELKERIERITEDLDYLKEYKKINAVEKHLREQFGEDNLKFFQDVIGEDRKLGEMAKVKWEKDLAKTEKELKRKEKEQKLLSESVSLD